MNAGPIPPPPLKWQPLQLYEAKYCFPWAMKVAFPS